MKCWRRPSTAMLTAWAARRMDGVRADWVGNGCETRGQGTMEYEVPPPAGAYIADCSDILSAENFSAYAPINRAIWINPHVGQSRGTKDGAAVRHRLQFYLTARTVGEYLRLHPGGTYTRVCRRQAQKGRSD